MKVLFVSSGNSKDGISPIVKSQGESLRQNGVDLHYFTIKGKGFKGYLSNIKCLKRVINNLQPDIVHAHYSLTAIIATLAGCKPLVVSLMGSDVKSKGTFRLIIKLFAFFFSWKDVIVKSEDMRNSIGINRSKIIPNGVDLDRFSEMDKKICMRTLGWDNDKKHILFTSNPDRREKNYEMAVMAVEKLNKKDVELHFMRGVGNGETPLWYNASDVVLLTSLWEGSPNAIKESMACNRPIVSTDVGDVRWIMGETQGCYITSFDVDDCTDKIKRAIDFYEKYRVTNGRERIVELELDSRVVAERIVEIYKRLI